MKRLVVYFTRSGHSKAIADNVCKIWGAESVELVDLNKRKGLFGFILSGMDAKKDRVAEIELALNPNDYDEVMLVAPIWAGTTPPAVNGFLKSYSAQYGIVSSGGPIIPEKLTPVKTKMGVEKLLALSKKEWQTTDKVNEWMNSL